MERGKSRVSLKRKVLANRSVTAISIGLLLGLATVGGTSPRAAKAPARSGLLLFAEYGGFPAIGVGDGVPGLYRVNADGTSLRPLHGRFYPGDTPDWSVDGRRIAYSRWLDTEDARSARFGFDLTIADANVAARRALVEHTDALPFPTRPEWSPDGHKIAFVNSGPDDRPQIFITDTTVGPSHSGRRVSGTEGAASVGWSSTGDELVFDLYYKSSGIYRVSARGGARRLLVPHAHAPSWSPDGAEIAYIADSGGLYVLNLQTGKPHLVTHSCSKASTPEWSPDGHWIAFADCLRRTAARGDPRALTVVRTNGSGRRLILSSHFAVSSPSWH